MQQGHIFFFEDLLFKLAHLLNVKVRLSGQ